MHHIQLSQAKWPLDALMSITQVKFHATDQRDKIYGLFSLAAECQDTAQLPDALRPDYAKDETLVYQEVGRFLLERNRSLAMLTRTHGTAGSLTRRQRVHDLKFASLPSWAPDWSDFRCFNREIRTSFSWIDFSDTFKPPRLGYPEQYNASAGLPLMMHDTVDRRVLRVSGIRMGVVAQVLAFDERGSPRDEFEQDFASNMARICEAAISLLKDTEISSWATAFIKASTAEQHRLGGRARDQSFRDGMAYLHALLLDNEAQMSAFIATSGNDEAMDVLRRLGEGGEPGEYEALARNYCFHRCFIVTSTGRTGTGPSDTHVSDAVAIIPGGGVPYIIREQGKNWVFVGESYVEGLMDGEAVQACLRQGVAREEVLDIV